MSWATAFNNLLQYIQTVEKSFDGFLAVRQCNQDVESECVDAGILKIPPVSHTLHMGNCRYDGIAIIADNLQHEVLFQQTIG